MYIIATILFSLLIKTTDDESYKVQFLSFFGPAQESFVTVFKYAVVE